MIWELKTWIKADGSKEAVHKLMEICELGRPELNGEPIFKTRPLPDDSLIPDHITKRSEEKGYAKPIIPYEDREKWALNTLADSLEKILIEFAELERK